MVHIRGRYQKIPLTQQNSKNTGRDLCSVAPSSCTGCHCSPVDNSKEIGYCVVQMVLSINSGSRLAMDGEGALAERPWDVHLRLCGAPASWHRRLLLHSDRGH